MDFSKSKKILRETKEREDNPSTRFKFSLGSIPATSPTSRGKIDQLFCRVSLESVSHSIYLPFLSIFGSKLKNFSRDAWNESEKEKAKEGGRKKKWNG